MFNNLHSKLAKSAHRQQRLREQIVSAKEMMWIVIGMTIGVLTGAGVVYALAIIPIAMIIGFVYDNNQKKKNVEPTVTIESVIWMVVGVSFGVLVGLGLVWMIFVIPAVLLLGYIYEVVYSKKQGRYTVTGKKV